MQYEQLEQLTDILSALNYSNQSAFQRFSLTLADIRRGATYEDVNPDQMVATVMELIEQGNVGLGQFKRSEYLTHPSDNLDDSTVWTYQDLDRLIDKLIAQMQVLA